eukprot:TRINITY_DN3146_c0_g1_i2.p4 TRINITY_DN3146_c0_g1~~TRINITY_DN3146_c0_g1_i2.p4  ORF type:complete len:341 (-),score=104.31 TRINITY_DN3146_c0_g1_i2:176-1198(-)
MDRWEPRGSAMSHGASMRKAQPADDWAGVSLGDTLASAPQRRRNFGPGAGQPDAGPPPMERAAASSGPPRMAAGPGPGGGGGSGVPEDDWDWEPPPRPGTRGGPPGQEQSGGPGRQPQAMQRGPPAYDDDMEDDRSMAASSAPGFRQFGGGFDDHRLRGGGEDPDDAADFGPPPPQRAPPRANARRQAPVEEDCWAGQGLEAAFAKKQAPSVGGGGGGGSSASGAASRRPAAAPSGGGGGGGSVDKSVDQIVSWVRSLPESHVPEKTREQIVGVVLGENLSGRDFGDYVQRIPPEVCAPQQAMKLKAAWKNVIAEAAAKEVAAANAASNAQKQKATMLVC